MTQGRVIVRSGTFLFNENGALEPYDGEVTALTDEIVDGVLIRPIKLAKYGPLREYSWEVFDGGNIAQLTDDGILVAVERHWLTHSERQARQLERAMQAATTRHDAPSGRSLTLHDWRKFTSRMVIEQAIDEVLCGR